MTRKLARCASFILFMVLTACGGGGGGDDGSSADVAVSPFAESDATGTIPVTAVSLDSQDRSTSAETGTFDQDADTLSFATLSGALDADGETVTLVGGGVITITPGPTGYAAHFAAEPQGGDNRTIGVIGFETDLAELPSGSISYVGTSEMTVLDGESVYALTGNAMIEADFLNGLTDTTISNLSGTVTEGGEAPEDVSDVGSIRFIGSSITGARFTGGTAAINSTATKVLSGSQVSSIDGVFYGPQADEIGATFVIDDDANDGVVVQGRLLAD